MRDFSQKHRGGTPPGAHNIAPPEVCSHVVIERSPQCGSSRVLPTSIEYASQVTSCHSMDDGMGQLWWTWWARQCQSWVGEYKPSHRVAHQNNKLVRLLVHNTSTTFVSNSLMPLRTHHSICGTSLMDLLAEMVCSTRNAPKTRVNTKREVWSTSEHCVEDMSMHKVHIHIYIALGTIGCNPTWCICP